MDLIFQNKVPLVIRAAFIEKIKLVAKNLSIDPNWLMAIINFESAGTFSPSITNSLGYTGLIQFGAAAATELGTTTAALKVMTAVRQLDFVEKYYKMWYKRLKIVPQRFVDVYLITFFPIAANKPYQHVIQSKDLSAAKIASANRGLDIDKNGNITVAEIEKKMLSTIPIKLVEKFLKKKIILDS